MKKTKLKPGLAGLSAKLQYVAAKAIATVNPTMGNFARQMDAASALQETSDENSDSEATQAKQ